MLAARLQEEGERAEGQGERAAEEGSCEFFLGLPGRSCLELGAEQLLLEV